MNEKQKRKLLTSGKAVYCCNCGIIGWPKRITKGSIFTEAALWLFGLLGFAIVPLLGILLLAGGLAYSIWRYASQYRGCCECKSANIVPVSSPVAQQAILSNPQIYQ